MWNIINKLYLGTKEDSENGMLLANNGITHVVNCAAELPCLFEERFVYLHLPLKDPDFAFGDSLDAALTFIDGGRANGAVFVHCVGAISRSPATVMAYLCHCKYSIANAIQLINDKVRTRPNPIFVRQIFDYFGHSASDDEIVAIIHQLGIDNSQTSDSNRDNS